MSAQQINAQDSVIGREFWLTMIHNRSAGHDASYRVVITPSFHKTEAGLIRVSIPRMNYSETFLNGGNGIIGVNRLIENLSTEEVDNPFMGLNEGIDGMVIRVESEMDVIVYAHNYYDSLGNDHGDVAQILPTTKLGTEYYVVSHNEISNHFYSEAAIVAVQNGTFVDIIPTADTRQHQAGEKYTIELNAGERYQFQSKGDLTGTYIGLNPTLNQSCKPFAVFAGSLVSTVGDRTIPGHMSKQMIPLSMWGKSYSLVPFGGERNEYMVKVVAFENNTELTINGVKRPGKLKYGEYIRLDSDEEMRITSNKPIQVVQFYKGARATSGTKQDPFMLMVTADEHMAAYDGAFEPLLHFPLEKETNPIGINIPPPPFRNVLFNTADRGALNHDARNFSEKLKVFPPDQTMSYSSFELNTELDSLRVPEETGVLYDGYVLSRSTEHVNAGFRGTINFFKLDTLAIQANPFVDETTRMVCQSEPILFKPNFHGIEGYNPRFDRFTWDFGDGATADGDSVIHHFDRPGTYRVQLLGEETDGPCMESQRTSMTIIVADTEIKEVVGPASVCPNVEGVVYEAIGSEENDYSWSIEGGALQSTNGKSVIVDWGDTNADAFLQVIATNALGCDPDTLKYEVVINEALEPVLPQGLDSICFDQLEQVYSIPPSPGSIYDWTIDHGTIISGQGSHQIEVVWDGPGIGQLSYRESSTTRTDFCAGDSEILEVLINSQLVVDQQIEHVRCMGESNGTIALNVRGGTGTYEVEWSDGATGDTRTDLVAGVYTAVVRDELGCEVEVMTEITEPDELTAELILENIKCFTGQDGFAEVVIDGGTAPYQVFWNGSTQNTGTVLTGIGAGQHSVRIVDNLGCELIMNFELTQPEQLTAKTTDTPTCPGESTGTILVEASGGTRPYLYRWNTSPPQDAQLIRGLPAGLYSVTVTDANGCTFTFDDEQIREKYPRIQMPNAFSPNLDGKNDVFKAVYDCAVNFQMKIFSSWGEIIYYSDDINEGWDGTYRGKELPDGDYTYLISYQVNVNGLPFNEVVKGGVRIFR